MLLRESGELLVQDLPPVIGPFVVTPFIVATEAGPPLSGPTADGIRPGLDGDAMGDLAQPAAEGLLAPDRPSLADQDQERRLEGVLGVVGIAEHRAAECPAPSARAARPGPRRRPHPAR